MSPELTIAATEASAQRRELLERLRQSPEDGQFCFYHTALIDRLVQRVYAEVEEQFPKLAPLAVVATGGYGRSELAPYSDVDVTVVPLDESGPDVEEAVKVLFRLLQTALGTHLRLEVGYAYRLINDAPALDPKTRTALLDARLVAGSSEPLDALKQIYWSTFPVGEFLIAKVQERQAETRRYNDTPLAVELQIKEGAGGLRSMQCANWLRETIGERPVRETPAYLRLLRIRNLLHLVAGRRQDLLSRQRQAEIADLMGQDLYLFGSETAQAAYELHEEYRRALERLHEARFPLGGGVEAMGGEARIYGNPSAGSAAAGIALATQLGLRVADLPAGAAPQVDGREAMFALGSGEKTLRNLDRCGLLRALLPELEKCRTLMPRDSTHSYTVFEHTVRAIRNLDSLRPGTFLGDLMAGLREQETLYLATLLHDVGKADLTGPHSETGQRMAGEVAARWKLAQGTTELVKWLVREHLTMARVIRMRDVAQPQTAQEFAETVQDRERLDLLTLLTWADIAAVSPEAWSPVQESFLRQLYEHTAAILEGEAPTETDHRLYRQRLLRELKGVEAPEEEVEAFLESMPAHYWVSTPPDLVRLHMAYVGRARAGEPTVDIFHQPELGVTELTVCCKDEPGLLSKLLGVIYAVDLSVLGIRASTTQGEQPVALDVFSLSFGGRPIPPATERQLTDSMLRVLRGETGYEALLQARGKDPEGKQQSFKYTFLEGSPGILEVQAPRGRGMAYRFSRLIAEQGWDITAARVGQWAGRGAAAFYLFGPGQRALSMQEVEAALRSQE
jgi:[protein-PII] uridylyltransferase